MVITISLSFYRNSLNTYAFIGYEFEQINAFG